MTEQNPVQSGVPPQPQAPQTSAPSAVHNAAAAQAQGQVPAQPQTQAQATQPAAPAQQPLPAQQATPATAAPAANPLEAQLQALKNSILAGNIPQLVLTVISYALAMRSSDIHIEPSENTVLVRYRIDGILKKIVEYPQNLHPAVVSRIKIMSNLKIDEQRIPQDGRSEVTTEDNREMDLRVSTLPTVHGEKVVMRIQDKSREIPSLEKLGLAGVSLEIIQKSLALPNGIILTSGPTGSGKTTTLYSALTILNKPDVNILTIEDPVEITMQGLNQSQVHADIDYTFASGLRTALRQDPDIIMVGEIRDKETINVAIEAALTGHLVLSTIHTNSAVETLTRIINMGIQPFLMVATINAIIAQRLVRKICQDCKKEDTPEESVMKSVTQALEKLNEHEKSFYDAALFEKPTFYTGAGCDTCNGAGYLGRVGLYEVLQMTNDLKRMVVEDKSTLEIEEQAMKDGMVSLEQAGILHALKGDTSLKEVYRVARSLS